MVDILKCTNGLTHFPSTFDLHNMASVFETKKYLPPMTLSSQEPSQHVMEKNWNLTQTVYELQQK